MLSRLTCCYPRSEQGRERIPVSDDIEDEDYLLGGSLEWDSASRRFTSRSGVHRKYVPPNISQTKGSPPTIAEFRLLKTVGKGAFGKVTLAVHSNTRTLYALKSVPKSKITTQKQISQIQTEIQILRKVKHAFCVTLQYAFQDDNFLYYVFDFAVGGMLFHHLREEGKFDEARARFYIGEIIIAIEYLHGFGIIFRDLKPENCMLSGLGHIILTDFGSAKILDEGETSTTLAGTPQYIAPEVLRGEPYSYGADWWSCGILLYEMLAGKPPFNSHDRMELYRSVLRGDLKMPYNISARARSLLYKLIQKDPVLRGGGTAGEYNHIQSSSEIKAHPFFSMSPMDIEEAARHTAEHNERQRQQQAQERERTRRSRAGDSAGRAGNELIRSLSISTAAAARRFTEMTGGARGSLCRWTWRDLENRKVEPPFIPKPRHPTDCSYFDPVMTSIPTTLSDHMTTDRHLHIEAFEYVASSDISESTVTSTESTHCHSSEPLLGNTNRQRAPS